MSASVVNMSVLDGTVVHGWCGWVEKSNEVVSKLMVLNKLWIPDVLIDIIKDHLFVSAAEVLRKFYRLHLNSTITDLWVKYRPRVDIYGRPRKTVYALGYIYGGEDVQLQGNICVTCGDFDHRHDNANGCCTLMWDGADGELELIDDEVDLEVTDEIVAEINAENEDNEEIPEVTWDIDIPVSEEVTDEEETMTPAYQQSDEYRQFVLDNWNKSIDDAFQEAVAEMSSAINLEEVARQRADDALWGRQPDEQYDYDDEGMDSQDYDDYIYEMKFEAFLGKTGRR